MQKKNISCIPVNLFEKIVKEMETKIKPKHVRAAISRMRCEIFQPHIITEFFLSLIFADSFELLEPYKNQTKKAQSEIHASLMKKLLPATLQELEKQEYVVKSTAGRYMTRKKFFAMSSEEEQIETDKLCEDLKKEVKSWVSNYIQQKLIQLSEAEIIHQIGFWQPEPIVELMIPYYYQVPASFPPHYYEELLEDNNKINPHQNNNF